MKEINATELNDISGAGWAYEVGYALGKMLQNIGEIDMQGALAMGA